MPSQPTAFAVAERLAADLSRQPRGLMIDGKSVPALSGKTFATENPATGQAICQVAEGGAADVDLAVQAARRALVNPAWAPLVAFSILIALLLWKPRWL